MFKTQSSKFARIRVIRVIRSAVLVVDKLISLRIYELIVAISHS